VQVLFKRAIHSLKRAHILSEEPHILSKETHGFPYFLKRIQLLFIFWRRMQRRRFFSEEPNILSKTPNFLSKEPRVWLLREYLALFCPKSLAPYSFKRASYSLNKTPSWFHIWISMAQVLFNFFKRAPYLSKEPHDLHKEPYILSTKPIYSLVIKLVWKDARSLQ